MFGPIEKVDASTGVITILGQKFRTQAGSAAANTLAEQLRAGAQIIASVLGKTDASGKVQNAKLILSGSDYVPGASSVLVVGKVASVNPAIAEFKIGDLKVDYSALLSSEQVQISAGQRVAIVGSQSAAGLALIPDRIFIIR